MSSQRRTRAALLLLALAGLGACREGEGNAFGGFVPIPPSQLVNQGCNGPDQAFIAPVPVATTAPIGPDSKIVADALTDRLYLTGSDASVWVLDFTGGGAPVETQLVAPGEIDALLMPLGIMTPAQLSGLTILDLFTLVVLDLTSNSLISVPRDPLLPIPISFLGGLPDETPGFVDGVGLTSRFSFSTATEILNTGGGTLYLADPGNHAIRVLVVGALALTDTILGGTPGAGMGSFGDTRLDTPSGLSVACSGELFVADTDNNRLLSLMIGTQDFFGNFQGSSMVLVGDGTEATTEGIGDAAQTAMPKALVTTSGNEAYWIDSTTGILRRLDLTTGLADCPLFVDCATAVGAGGSFTNGGGFSTAVSMTDVLYVLDGDAGTLVQVAP